MVDPPSSGLGSADVIGQDSQPRPNNRRWRSPKPGIWRLVGIAILLVLLSRLDRRVLREVIEQADLTLLAAAVLLNLLILLLKAWRWRLLLRLQGYHLEWSGLLGIYLASLLLGIVTPGQLGELARALYLRQAGICNLAQGSASVLADRLLDLTLLVALAMTGLIWLSPLPNAAWLGWLGMGLVILGMVSWPLWARLAGGVLERLARWANLRRLPAATVHSFFAALQAFQTPGLTGAALLTIAAQALVLLQAYFIALSFGIETLGWHVIPIISSVNIVSIIPVSVLGLGTREAALIFLLSPYGVHASRTIAFSGGILLVVYLSAAAVGFVAWLRNPLIRPSATGTADLQDSLAGDR